VVDFDLPAVEVDWQQLGGGVPQVGGEQIGGLTVVELGALAFALETHPESAPATALSGFGRPNGRIEA
jgi:hypothetical protein